MSRPASSWSASTACVASWYASSWRTSLNATRTSRPSSCWWYQCGLGYEPTIVVGRSLSTIFFGIGPPVHGRCRTVRRLVSRSPAFSVSIQRCLRSSRRRLPSTRPRTPRAGSAGAEAGEQLGGLVEHEREQDQAADRHEGVFGRLLEQRQHVADQREEERSQQRPYERPFAAGQAGPAEDSGGDALEWLVADDRRADLDLGREIEAGDRGHQ